MKYASLPIFRIATDADLTDILFIEQGEQSSWNESTLRNALHSQYTVILALYENKIIGFAIVSTVVEEAELLHIAIHHSWRHRGLGTRLLAHSSYYCRLKHCRELRLEVRASNWNALNLYERAGFIKQSIRKNYYPSRNTLAAEDAILMSKSLHTSSTITHVETTLHYAFLHESKLIQAITHKSYVHDVDTHGLHNEVLEFQGDAVLGLIAVDKLLYEHPQANEGILTFLRSAYVSETALAQAIEHHQLASCLRVSPAITHITPSMTADMLEAIIGAVYLDGGLNAARHVIDVLLGPVPHEVTPLQSQAKRMLQERLQKYFAKAPTYQIEQTGGSLHAPIFTAYVLWGKHILGESTGTNKKEATEAAARNALDKLPSHDHDCMDYFRKHYS